MEAAQRYLEAKDRDPVGSLYWAMSTSRAFDMLKLEVCDEVAKPEWWSDEGLKAMSARVVRAAPNDVTANEIRAVVLSGEPWMDNGAATPWEMGPRSAAEFEKAATHYDRAAALSPALAVTVQFIRAANLCRTRSQAEGM